MNKVFSRLSFWSNVFTDQRAVLLHGDALLPCIWIVPRRRRSHRRRTSRWRGRLLRGLIVARQTSCAISEVGEVLKDFLCLPH